MSKRDKEWARNLVNQMLDDSGRHNSRDFERPSWLPREPRSRYSGPRRVGEISVYEDFGKCRIGGVVPFNRHPQDEPRFLRAPEPKTFHYDSFMGFRVIEPLRVMTFELVGTVDGQKFWKRIE